jgi:hypothetical protein
MSVDGIGQKSGAGLLNRYTQFGLRPAATTVPCVNLTRPLPPKAI